MCCQTLPTPSAPSWRDFEMYMDSPGLRPFLPGTALACRGVCCETREPPRQPNTPKQQSHRHAKLHVTSCTQGATVVVNFLDPPPAACQALTCSVSRANVLAGKQRHLGRHSRAGALPLALETASPTSCMSVQVSFLQQPQGVPRDSLSCCKRRSRWLGLQRRHLPTWRPPLPLNGKTRRMPRRT